MRPFDRSRPPRDKRAPPPTFPFQKQKGFFFYAVHQTLYLLFFFVGLVGLLESVSLLPPDSARAALALALALQILLWSEHAQGKSDPTEARVHHILGDVAAFSSAAVLLSVYFRHRLELYVAGHVGVLLQGMWLMAAAAIKLNGNVPAERVGVYFCLESLAVALAVVLSLAYVRSLLAGGSHAVAGRADYYSKVGGPRGGGEGGVEEEERSDLEEESEPFEVDQVLA